MSVTDIRKTRWADFYSSKNASLVLIHFPNDGRPWPYDENKDKRIQWSVNTYRNQLDALSWLDDDRVPYVNPYTGTEIFARAFGAKVHHSDDMPFALPAVHSSKELAGLKYPSLASSSIMEIFDIADKLLQAEPEALLALPDIQSPLDIAALIWDKTDFFPAMIEDPEAVKELISMTHSFLTEFLDMWFDRYGKEFIAHYPDYYMPYGITLSEDEVGVISSDAFKEFSLPSLNALSERYGGIGIHCCANSMHQWNNFKDIKGLKLLNIVQPEEVVYKAHKDFEGVCAQMHANNPKEKISGRVVWQETALSKDEAIEKCKILRELSEKYMEASLPG